MKLLPLIFVVMASVFLAQIKGSDVPRARLAESKRAMRAKLFQTLGIPAKIYEPWEFSTGDGRDLGAEFLRDHVKNLFPRGTERREVLAALKRMMDATKDVPGRELKEEGFYISLQVTYEETLEHGYTWLTIGNVDFKFDTQGLLERGYYTEVGRDGDRMKPNKK